jgi:hypothetical protein
VADSFLVRQVHYSSPSRSQFSIILWSKYWEIIPNFSTIKVSTRNKLFLWENSWKLINKKWTDCVKVGKISFSCVIDAEDDFDCGCGVGIHVWELDADGFTCGWWVLMVKLHENICCDGLLNRPELDEPKNFWIHEEPVNNSILFILLLSWSISH